MSIAFLLTTLVVVATPGTGAVYSIAAGLSRGSRAGVIAAFGCTLGVSRTWWRRLPGSPRS
jgi:threonine/homoserine/homoserine lactone efflux protein